MAFHSSFRRLFPDAWDHAGRQVETGLHYVYFLECSDGSIYVGYTGNIVARLLRHFTGSGARWVSARLPASLVGVELFDNPKEALKRESELHKLSDFDLRNLLNLGEWSINIDGSSVYSDVILS